MSLWVIADAEQVYVITVDHLEGRRYKKKKERYISNIQSFWMTFSSKPRHLMVAFFVVFHASTFQ